MTSTISVSVQPLAVSSNVNVYVPGALAVKVSPVLPSSHTPVIPEGQGPLFNSTALPLQAMVSSGRLVAGSSATLTSTSRVNSSSHTSS